MLRRLAADVRHLPSVWTTWVIAACVIVLGLYSVMTTGDNIFLSQDIANAYVVGNVIGYVANCIDPHDLIGTAIRNSFFLTFLWVPLAVACAVGMASSNYRSKSYCVSRARGLTAARGVVSEFLACSLVVGSGYAVMCAVSFLAAATRYGAVIDGAALMRFAGCSLINVFLLMSVVAQSLALYHVTRNPFVSVVGITVLFLYASTISWFDKGGRPLANADWVMLTPAPYLLFSCALAFGRLSISSIVVYAVESVFVALIVGVAAFKIRGK